MRNLVILSFALLVGCGESGACIERISANGVSYSWCKQAKHQSECPVLESGDEGFEFRWEWHGGKKCKKLGYDFDCGYDIFEDVETECVFEE